MAKNERVYYHYSELEEFSGGMWKITRGDERKEHMANAANLMKNPDAFTAAMQRAVNEWPKSAAASLTADGVNKIAWLGHAGCCVGVGSPEEATRAGWHTLDTAEQDAANQAAQDVLDQWEREYSARIQPSLFG